MAIIDRITGEPWSPNSYDERFHGVDESLPFPEDMQKYWEELRTSNPELYCRIFPKEIIQLDVLEKSTKNIATNAIISYALENEIKLYILE